MSALGDLAREKAARAAERYAPDMPNAPGVSATSASAHQRWRRLAFTEGWNAALASLDDPAVVQGIAEELYRQDNPTRMVGLNGAPNWKQQRYVEKAQALVAALGGRADG